MEESDEMKYADTPRTFLEGGGEKEGAKNRLMKKKKILKERGKRC